MILDLVRHEHRREHQPCRSCYVAGCRCWECRAAEAAYWHERKGRDRPTYRCEWRRRPRGYVVLNRGRILFRAPTLLECENWVMRGGADAYETSRVSNGCSTMGRTTARQNGGAGGELALPPAGRSSTWEEPTDG